MPNKCKWQGCCGNRDLEGCPRQLNWPWQQRVSEDTLIVQSNWKFCWTKKVSALPSLVCGVESIWNCHSLFCRFGWNVLDSFLLPCLISDLESFQLQKKKVSFSHLYPIYHMKDEVLTPGFQENDARKIHVDPTDLFLLNALWCMDTHE